MRQVCRMAILVWRLDSRCSKPGRRNFRDAEAPTYLVTTSSALAFAHMPFSAPETQAPTEYL